MVLLVPSFSDASVSGGRRWEVKRKVALADLPALLKCCAGDAARFVAQLPVSPDLYAPQRHAGIAGAAEQRDREQEADASLAKPSLYVAQGEWAVVGASRANTSARCTGGCEGDGGGGRAGGRDGGFPLRCVGSDDATTCVVLVVVDRATGTAAVAHVDAPGRVTAGGGQQGLAAVERRLLAAIAARRGSDAAEVNGAWGGGGGSYEVAAAAAAAAAAASVGLPALDLFLAGGLPSARGGSDGGSPSTGGTSDGSPFRSEEADAAFLVSSGAATAAAVLAWAAASPGAAYVLRLAAVGDNNRLKEGDADGLGVPPPPPGQQSLRPGNRGLGPPPAVRGLAVHLGSGEVFPAAFGDGSRGPLLGLRGLRPLFSPESAGLACVFDSASPAALGTPRPPLDDDDDDGSPAALTIAAKSPTAFEAGEAATEAAAAAAAAPSPPPPMIVVAPFPWPADRATAAWLARLGSAALSDAALVAEASTSPQHEQGRFASDLRASLAAYFAASPPRKPRGRGAAGGGGEEGRGAGAGAKAGAGPGPGAALYFGPRLDTPATAPLLRTLSLPRE